MGRWITLLTHRRAPIYCLIPEVIYQIITAMRNVAISTCGSTGSSPVAGVKLATCGVSTWR